MAEHSCMEDGYTEGKNSEGKSLATSVEASAELSGGMSASGSELPHENADKSPPKAEEVVATEEAASDNAASDRSVAAAPQAEAASDNAASDQSVAAAPQAEGASEQG